MRKNILTPEKRNLLLQEIDSRFRAPFHICFLDPVCGFVDPIQDETGGQYSWLCRVEQLGGGLYLMDSWHMDNPRAYSISLLDDESLQSILEQIKAIHG